ncbi:hypothetical protein ACFVWX_04035 [Streptomyces sp. NPDC058220]|uniref:hypothetical protein n=1 Tax=unclassified Streptomyces TaxID=2593676 RepID=UPI0036507F75
MHFVTQAGFPAYGAIGSTPFRDRLGAQPPGIPVVLLLGTSKDICLLLLRHVRSGERGFELIDGSSRLGDLLEPLVQPLQFLSGLDVRAMHFPEIGFDRAPRSPTQHETPEAAGGS